MYRYRNHNTGDVVERRERWPRLDGLPNWELVDAPAAPTLPRPAGSDCKADWVAYIAASTDLSRAEAEDMTKADLMALAEE